MTYQVRFDEEAIVELQHAADWYDRHRPGLGHEFTDHVVDSAESLRTFPNSGTPLRGVRGDLVARQIRMFRFPYLVVYVVSDDAVRVVAVAHERQLPGYWEHRLEP